MNIIRGIWQEYPFFGYRKITAILRNMGHTDNHKRVQRLMRAMGIQAIYPKHRTSIANKEHKKYPYLLKNFNVTFSNQVFATDITYLKLHNKFTYFIAIIDLYSRFIVSWNLAKNMDALFCLEALREAFKIAIPKIVNSDQGSQFTSDEWINFIEAQGATVSMCGKGRCFDNIFAERLWRSLKYEEFYLKSYDSYNELYNSLDGYVYFYNHIRPHSSLQYRVPNDVYNTKKS